MAHFANLDKNNVVTQVIVIADEHETNGEQFINETLGLPGKWIQTSYNGRIRKRFAGIGYTYDEKHDAFIPPKPEVEGKVAKWDSKELYWFIEE